MSKQLYNVVFFGAVQEGQDKKAVLMAMAKMFKSEPKKVLPYFSGKRCVIKGKIDEATTRKYKAALEKIGMVVKIEKVSVEGEAQAPKPTKKPVAAAGPDSKKQIDTGGLTMAEVGADVIENPVEVTPQPIGDISDISMAEVGADVIENPREKEIEPLPDISDLSLAEVGADVVENPKKKEAEPLPDISELSLE